MRENFLGNFFRLLWTGMMVSMFLFLFAFAIGVWGQDIVPFIENGKPIKNIGTYVGTWMFFAIPLILHIAIIKISSLSLKSSYIMNMVRLIYSLMLGYYFVLILMAKGMEWFGSVIGVFCMAIVARLIMCIVLFRWPVAQYGKNT